MRLITKSLGVLKCQLNFLTNRVFSLPFILLDLTTRCNSRCLTCDFWKTQDRADLSLSEIKNVADSAGGLDIKSFVLSGGEPLLHPNFIDIVKMLDGTRARLKLATNGILLEKWAPFIARFFSKVFISLDGSTPELYRKVRGVDAFTQVVNGIRILKELNPSITVIGRTIVQKSNYFDLIPITKTAKDIGIDHVSFQAADVRSSSFGRKDELGQERARHILLDDNDLICFKRIVNDIRRTNPLFFSSNFIIDGFRNLINIYNYYGAMIGSSGFPRVYCNLPWIFTVVEADGKIRPCYFHRDIGDIRQEPFEKIVNSTRAIGFRRDLKRIRHPMCIHCVFSSTRVRSRMLYKDLGNNG